MWGSEAPGVHWSATDDLSVKMGCDKSLWRGAAVIVPAAAPLWFYFKFMIKRQFGIQNDTSLTIMEER